MYRTAATNGVQFPCVVLLFPPSLCPCEAAAAREAELLAADPSDSQILRTPLWSLVGLPSFLVSAGVTDVEAYLWEEAAHSMDSTLDHPTDI
jgi:hypothetical protein